MIKVRLVEKIFIEPSKESVGLLRKAEMVGVVVVVLSATKFRVASSGWPLTLITWDTVMTTAKTSDVEWIGNIIARRYSYVRTTMCAGVESRRRDFEDCYILERLHASIAWHVRGSQNTSHPTRS